MRTAFIVLIAAFFLCGLIIIVRGKSHRNVYKESYIESLAPMSVGNFQTQLPTDPNSTVTYKMDSVTYKALEPFGIVCRVMSNPTSSVGGAPEAYDTVFIVGDGEHTFHTPEVCFQTQGNEILKQDTIQVPTRTRGNVPTTLLEIKNLQRGSISLAAFTFQGPYGMRAEALDLVKDLLWNEFRTGSPSSGAFYRFISQSDGTDPNTRERLIKFMGDYLDEIHRTSNGAF